tara:strand:- start:6266 stop:6490 length:225 start_codon:yes stop_codon:yes gene_type:complete
MDPTDDSFNDSFNDSTNRFRNVIIFSNNFILGKSIYDSNEKIEILAKEKYILNFIKEYNSSLNYLNKFEINLNK